MSQKALDASGTSWRPIQRVEELASVISAAEGSAASKNSSCIVDPQHPQHAHCWESTSSRSACVLSRNILKKGPLHMVIETQHALLSLNILKKRPVDILESRHQGEESLNIVVSQQHSQNEQNSPRRIQMLFLVFQQCTVQFFCIFKDIL